MWLNDHVGERLGVSVAVTDGSAFVLSGHGELQHWSPDAPERTSGGGRGDISGVYTVGEWSLDVTGLHESYGGRLIALGGGAEHIEVLLAEEVSLEVSRSPDEW
jgi:hypothetical protein